MEMANMDAGLSLRLLMAERNINGVELAKELGITSQAVSVLRRNPLISGKALVMLCEYFQISAVEFIKKGERKEG